MKGLTVAVLVLLLVAPAAAHAGEEHTSLSDHTNASAENVTGGDGFAGLYGSDDPVLLGGVLAWLGLVVLLSAAALHLHRRDTAR